MNLDKFNDLSRLAVLYRTGRTNSEFIASHLGVSNRHLRRLMVNLQPPKPKLVWNRLPDEIRQYLISQKQDNPNYNCQWLSELASDRFERIVSRPTVWRVLKEAKLLHCTPDMPILRCRFEAKACGDLVQMDTTWGYWLGDKKLYLTVLIDDYSRYILNARWALQETLWHNMLLIRETAEKYGIFRVLYTDNASWFKVLRHNRSIYQNHRQSEYESEITRACRETGIVHVTHQPYQPCGKGKIERLFRFIQERFVSELDSPDIPLYVINKKFQDWIGWYNDRHINRTIGCVPKKRFDPQGFVPLTGIQKRTLDDTFCLKDTRVADKCNQFSYRGNVYTIEGKRSYAHRHVDLHIHPNCKIRLWHNKTFLTELPIKG